MALAVDTGGTSPFVPELCLRTGLLSWGLSQAALPRGEDPLKAEFSACRATRNGTGKGKGHSSLRCSTPKEKKRSRQLPPALSVHLLYTNRGKVPVFVAGSGNAEVLVLLSTDIDECESRDTCQHECRNSLGSFQCVCPAGYRLMPNGKTCQGTESHPAVLRAAQKPHTDQPQHMAEPPL